METYVNTLVKMMSSHTQCILYEKPHHLDLNLVEDYVYSIILWDLLNMDRNHRRICYIDALTTKRYHKCLVLNLKLLRDI